MQRFQQLFSHTKCAVIGMIHLRALPGTPLSCLKVKDIVNTAVQEAQLYKKCNVDAVLVENMHDLPYVTSQQTGPEVTAVMSCACAEVKKAVGDLPCGVQILAGNNLSAMAVAVAAELQFIRAEGFVFSHVADEGIINACAGELLRYRRSISADEVSIFVDIKKKHCSHAITGDIDVVGTAKAAEFFMSNGVILTGAETGDPANVKELKDVRSSVKIPVLLGSGVTNNNIQDYFHWADAVIVGSHFKEGGNWKGNLCETKIQQFMLKVKELREGHS